MSNGKLQYEVEFQAKGVAEVQAAAGNLREDLAKVGGAKGDASAGGELLDDMQAKFAAARARAAAVQQELRSRKTSLDQEIQTMAPAAALEQGTQDFKRSMRNMKDHLDLVRLGAVDAGQAITMLGKVGAPVALVAAIGGAAMALEAWKNSLAQAQFQAEQADIAFMQAGRSLREAFGKVDTVDGLKRFRQELRDDIVGIDAEIRKLEAMTEPVTNLGKAFKGLGGLGRGLSTLAGTGVFDPFGEDDKKLEQLRARRAQMSSMLGEDKALPGPDMSRFEKTIAQADAQFNFGSALIDASTYDQLVLVQDKLEELERQRSDMLAKADDAILAQDVKAAQELSAEYARLTGQVLGLRQQEKGLVAQVNREEDEARKAEYLKPMAGPRWQRPDIDAMGRLGLGVRDAVGAPERPPSAFELRQLQLTEKMERHLEELKQGRNHDDGYDD